MTTKSYEYDIALSYAGENERFVRQVYRHLAEAGLKVFFAPGRAGELWGKDESEFQRAYGPASRFVVPFISEDYANKEWPQLEFRAARKEAQSRTGDFILPVRLDSAKMRGLPAKLQYLDGHRHSPRAIARMLIEDKLGRPLPAGLATGTPALRRLGVRILTEEDARLLGLVATAIFPFRAAELQRLIPDLDWSAAARRWRRLGFLKPGRGHLEVVPDIRRQLFATSGRERKAHERWTKILFSLREHSDAALVLGLHYASLRRIGQMLDILIPIADGLEPGFWNDLYLNIFERLEKTPHVRTADPKSRVLFHNSYALLLTRSERHGDALAQFAKLRTLSKRTKNAWGEGQSYINAGVAASHAGDERAAIAWYEKAIAHARFHRDHVLLGRSMGNLANFVDREKAAKLLDDSERVKIRVGDVSGLAGTLMARGNLAASSGDFAAARRYYRRAATFARRLDLRYVQVMAFRNLGRTEVDLGRPKDAVPFYRKAQTIAEKEGYSEQLRYAVAGEAIAHAEAKEFRRAEKLFQRLVALDRKRGDERNAVVALHDVGAMQVLQKRRSDAYATFQTVIAQAKKARLPEWVYRTRIDTASVAPSAATAVELLRAARPAALRAGDIDRAVFCSVHIAEWYFRQDDANAGLRELASAIRIASAQARTPLLADQLSILIDTGASDRRIGFAFHQLVTAARKAGDQERLLNAHMALGDWLWENGTLDERARAYQAYVAAFIPAVAISFEVFLRVGMHAAMHLHTLFRQEDRLEMLDVIEHKTHRWLSRQKAAKEHHDLVLWPLRLARRILQRNDLGEHMTGQEMTRMLTEEVKRGMGPSLRKGPRSRA